MNVVMHNDFTWHIFELVFHRILDITGLDFYPGLFFLYNIHHSILENQPPSSIIQVNIKGKWPEIKIM